VQKSILLAGREEFSMKKLSVYVHIPFCVRKCAYCDFISFKYEPEAVKAYRKALLSEIESYSELLSDFEIKSIFIGGGTPSLMPEDFHEELISAIASKAHIEKNAEITMEANPDSILERDSKRLLLAGYNRLSIGIQSFDDCILKQIGRVHDSRQSLLAFEHARKGGFENISIDLMYGLPGQTMDRWKKDLGIAADELSPEHISSYSLIVNENTPIMKLLNNSPGIFPEEKEDREMHHFCTDFLASRGYCQYEVSNYAKEGRESLHNKNYWERGNYLGLGVAAHSFIGKERCQNTSNFEDYVKRAQEGKTRIVESEILTQRDEIFEEIFLGLRMTSGIDMEPAGKRIGIDFERTFKKTTAALKKNGLVVVENGRLLLTRKGMDLSNSVFLEFLNVIDQNY